MLISFKFAVLEAYAYICEGLIVSADVNFVQITICGFCEEDIRTKE